MNILHCGDALIKGAVKMPQHLRKSERDRSNTSNEDLSDLDISELTGWINNTNLDPVAIEYGLLNMLKQPSEAQSDRIQEILDEAAEDNALGFWVNEINHILGHRQGWLDDSCRKDYERSKAELSKDAYEFQKLLENRNTKEVIQFIQVYLEEHAGFFGKTLHK